MFVYVGSSSLFSRWEPPTPDFAALVDQKLASFNDVVSLKSQVIDKSNKYFFPSCDIYIYDVQKRIEELEQERQRQIVRDAIADNLKVYKIIYSS